MDILAGHASCHSPRMSTPRPNDLSNVSEVIRAVVADAQALGIAVDTVATWSKVVVVHMASPLSSESRAALKVKFAHVRYFQTVGTPHNAPDEGFFNDDAAAAVSFPMAWPV
jgi:hypothetical protein